MACRFRSMAGRWRCRRGEEAEENAMSGVETIGIAGLGLLGSGIATCMLSHGLRVTGYDPSPEARSRTRAVIAGGMEDLVRRGGFPAALIEEWQQRYVEAASIAEFVQCDFVIE